MASSAFDWQSILARGKPAGYVNGPLVTDKLTLAENPHLQATLDYNKALRYQESARRQQEAAQQYGVSTNELRGTPAGWMPQDSTPVRPPADNGTGVVGGSATGTPNVSRPAPAPVAPPPVAPPPAAPVPTVPGGRTTDGTVSADWTRGPAVGRTAPTLSFDQIMQLLAPISQAPQQQQSYNFNMQGLFASAPPPRPQPMAPSFTQNTQGLFASAPPPRPQPMAPSFTADNMYAPRNNNPLGTPTTAGLSNPYLGAMGQAVTQQANQNLTRNVLPSINRNAVAMGGYGDSRQGIAQGIAIGDTQQGIANALAGMYGNAYNQDRQYDLTRIGQDQGFYAAQRGLDLQAQGLADSRYNADRNFDLSRAGQNQSFYSTQRGLDLTQNAQASNQYLQALNALTGLGQGVTNIGNQQMLASLFPYQSFGNLLNPLTGLNSTNTTQGPGSGGGLGGALGGGLTVAQLLEMFGG